MLIIFGGLPGTGKTTLSRAIAQERGASYLRIDLIEQALRTPDQAPGADVGPAGYLVAYALADANLRLGQTVVADSVNPVAITRDAWRAIATEAGVRAIEIEIICSDKDEHRRRVETRRNDIAGHVQPSWQQVIDRGYEPWTREHVVIDTAKGSIEDALALIRAALR